MWKKPFTAHKKTLLKSSDKRKLKEQLLQAFRGLKQEDLEELIPQKADVSVTKVQGSHTLIYTKDEQPLFIDSDGRQNFYPSVYALWQLPEFLPAFDIHPATFKYIMSGADLMLPGVIPPSDGFTPFWPKQKRVIRVVGTKTALGVGLTDCSADDIKRNGMVGKALTILHSYMDTLWRSGDKSHPPILPDENQDIGDTPESGEVNQIPDQPETPCDIPQELPQENIELRPQENTGATLGDQASQIQEQDCDVVSGISAATIDSEVGSKPTESSISVEEMDSLLTIAMLQAIKRRLKDKDLPMLASQFYSSLLLPCRPLNQSINVKRTSWKKFGTFLSFQAANGLISIEEPSEGVIQITKINREHPDYTAFKPLPVAATHESDLLDGPQEPDSTGPVIVESWQLPKTLGFLLTDTTIDEPTDIPSLTKALWEYTARHDLTKDTDPQHVVLDSYLANSLFAKRFRGGDKVEKRELSRAFREKLVRLNEVTVAGETVVRKGDLPRIQVLVEARQGRKWMTRIVGLQSYGLDPKEVARRCQKKFASSATVVKAPGQKGKLELFEVNVQGSWEAQVAEMLINELGIPAKYIEATKKGK